MKIGMRNIKTAIAVTLSVAISKALHMEYPFYVGIAAIISMESTVIGSYKVGRNRLLGTFIGALIGFFFAIINPNSLFLLGIGIMIIIYICNLLKWNSSISIAGVAFCAIMINLGGDNAFSYSYNRLFDTFLGIIVSILVNYFVFPPNYFNELLKTSEELICYINEFSTLEVENLKLVNTKDFYERIKSLESLYKNYTSEFKIKNTDQIKLSNVSKIIEISKDLHSHLKVLSILDDDTSSCAINCNIETVYDFHNCKVYELIKKLNA